MEQNFWQKLQRVKLHDIIHVMYFMLALPISVIYRQFRKNLWLICDNENEARDNGYWLFKYIVENHSEEDIIYAINKKSPDYNRVKNLGRVVQYGSFMHWVYYLTANKNISSQKGGKPNAAICYVLEVYDIIKNTRIFLQHGITKDDVPFLYYKNTKMRMFVCAVDREYEYVKNVFGYPEGYVCNLGFARFDNLYSENLENKQILVMPTWRNWIGRPTLDSFKHEDIREFTNTEYFKYWNDFLEDEQFLKILEDNNIQLIFYPHREMQRYLKEFNITHKNIVIASWPKYDVQQLLKESSFLITDYSSVAMDFAYMNKPLAYYQFDYKRFREGHYSEGYFSYEKDGFGPVCYEAKEVINVVVDSMNRKFENSEEYHNRQKNFFTVCDSENCKRNYEAIEEI